MPLDKIEIRCTAPRRTVDRGAAGAGCAQPVVTETSWNGVGSISSRFGGRPQSAGAPASCLPDPQDQVVVTVASTGGTQDPHTLCGGSAGTTAEIQRHPVLPRRTWSQRRRSKVRVCATIGCGCSWTRVRHQVECTRDDSYCSSHGTPAHCGAMPGDAAGVAGGWRFDDRTGATRTRWLRTNGARTSRCRWHCPTAVAATFTMPVDQPDPSCRCCRMFAEECGLS